MQKDEGAHSLPTFHKHIQDSFNFSDGKWITHPPRIPTYDHTCKEIFKDWNCLSANKSNAPLLPPHHPVNNIKHHK
ncbi:uncharacterized protein HKW66_Vig0057710 [Vigna angularis]|uniref:Uncharacterized protein n=1 Tax=Phaseolus angularis TaxID=3914 RepID=A0A8T0L928_PHAAN|nr:uncharacterized protein HKW66_Vig0057710 [Vigna angularis]